MTLEATAPAQQPDGFVGQRKVTSESNPHEPRYAYMPPVLNAKSDARVTGFHFFVPGTLIQFRTFQSGGWPNPSFMEDSSARGLIRDFSAEQAAKNADVEWGAGLQGRETGYTPLPMLTGVKDAQKYFDAIHPAFDRYSHQCPFGLDVCPTCRSQWLEADASKGYFAQHGTDLDRDLALSVKEALYAANQTNINFATNLWNELADQYERTRNQGQAFVLDKTHHHYRKCLHLPTFEERELQKIQMMTASNAQAIGAAVGSFQVPQNDQAQYEAWKAEQNTPVQNGAVKPDVPSTDFKEGMDVICEGTEGKITEVKNAGWFDVTLADGNVKTVRKDKLEVQYVHV